MLGSLKPITGPPINSAPPEFTIFPCSKGEKERRKPYYQLVAGCWSHHWAMVFWDAGAVGATRGTNVGGHREVLLPLVVAPPAVTPPRVEKPIHTRHLRIPRDREVGRVVLQHELNRGAPIEESAATWPR